MDPSSAAAAAAGAAPPTAEQLAAAEAAVAEQGALVRCEAAPACLPAYACSPACLPGQPSAQGPGAAPNRRLGLNALAAPPANHPSASLPPCPCAPPRCRSLKEEQGLGNSSEEVTAAVAALLDLKAQLAALQAAAAAAGEAAAAAEQAGSE